AFFERADSANITVTLRGRGIVVLESVTLPVAADASITHNGKPLRLADLKPGWMKIMLSPDESKVVAIRVEDREFNDMNDARRAPELRGTRKALDRDRRITVTRRSGGHDHDRTVPLAKSLKVEIDETPAALADLKPGMAVWLKLAPDGDTVLEIKARKST